MNLTSGNVQLDIITLLLMIPVVATWIAFARHVIGFKAFGEFITLIMTFVFFELGLSPTLQSQPLVGLRYGLVLFVIIFVSTTVAYGLIKGWSLHYQPKIAIVVTLITLVLASIIIISIRFNLSDLIRLDLISLIAIVALSESIVTILSRKTFKKAFYTMLESLVVAIIAYLIISWEKLTGLLFDYPLLILLLLPVNYLIGRFTGLRAREFLRFRNILEDEE